MSTFNGSPNVILFELDSVFNYSGPVTNSVARTPSMMRFHEYTYILYRGYRSEETRAIGRRCLFCCNCVCTCTKRTPRTRRPSVIYIFPVKIICLSRRPALDFAVLRTRVLFHTRTRIPVYSWAYIRIYVYRSLV